MKGCKGSTFIEVLVTSAIVLVGVAGFTTLQSRLLLSDQNLLAQQKALLLLERKQADLQSFVAQNSSRDGYMVLNDDVGGQLAAGQYQDKQLASELELHWQISSGHTGNTKTVEIRVTWSASSGMKGVSLVGQLTFVNTADHYLINQHLPLVTFP